MAVGLIVGGWFASAVIGKLISMAFSYIGDQYKWQTGMKDELERLKEAHHKIEAVVEAAEDGHVKDRTGSLESWLWQLKDAASEADDVLDEMEYLHLEEQVKAGNYKVSDTASFLMKIMERAVERDPTLMRLKEAVKKLDEATADVGVFFALIVRSAAKSQQQQSEIRSSRKTSSVLRNEVIGRNMERDEIVNQLLITNPVSTKTNLPVILISGIGGVGKTTLAQYVLDDERVKNHFDLKIWVSVSDVFDVTMLTSKILEAVIGKTPSVTSFEMLQKNLMEILLKPEPKSFLLVLDDVWNDADWASWENLLAPLRYGHRKSKIVVTTRMAAVAKVIKGTTYTYSLMGLADHDCWLLLMERAFGDEDPDDYPELQSIGYQIAQKLRGSPLAAKTIGGLLRSKLDDEHWSGILETDILDLKQGEGDIMPVLRLSYDHLPAHLQSCFAYCSIFLQDHTFHKDDLVRMWVAAGLIQHENSEDTGGKYFENLLDKSFFDKGHSDNIYVMHDHLHDLARQVSADECLRLPLMGAASKEIPHSVRHLSLTINCNDPSVLDKVCKVGKLRTLHLSLIGGGTEIGPALKKLLKELKSLRVLELHSEYKLELPDTIGESIHLRYLNLTSSGNLSLPNSLGRLYHLRNLHIPNASFIPEGLSNLINLQHMTAHPESVSAIACFGKLTRLQKLNGLFVKREGGCWIRGLKDMNELHELGIKNLENVMSYNEACEANLKDKEFLNTLELEWGAYSANPSTGSPEMDEQVFDGLQPHSNLKKLTIFRYRGTRSPLWMKASILSNLKHLYLRCCDGWEQLPPLGQLPFLKVLHFIKMRAIKRIGSHLYGVRAAAVFPSLEELVFEEMPQSANWSTEVDGRLWFPRLRLLRVKRFPGLTSWPAALPPSLTELVINNAGLTTLPTCWRGYDEAGVSQSIRSPSSPSTSSPSPYSSLSSSSSLLSSLSIRKCTNLNSVAVGLLQHKLLKFLNIEICPNLQALGIWTGHSPLLPSLQTLRLAHCGELDLSLPALLQGAKSLLFLELDSCVHMTSLPLGELEALQHLQIVNCTELMLLEGCQTHASLESLRIFRCPKLATTDTVHGLAPPLVSLLIDYSSLLVMLPVLVNVTTLVSVTIGECSELTSFPAEVEYWLLQNLDSLQELILYEANSLHTLPAEIQRITSYRQYELRIVSSP